MEKIKAGIEIHQQLDTHKLFCNCPSVLRKDPPDVIVRRKLHAVAGESGEVDVAAGFEAEKDQEFIYQGYSDTNCLVEYDEEPPYLVNEEALRIALHVSLLLNCEILPISQVMRKTVVDGSNTSGFQRTVLIARNGHIETSAGKVRIENVSLEEDAARIVGVEGVGDGDGNENKNKIYRLDRLGIPLIEIGTYPDIKSGQQVKEAALLIGDILRSCKVKRGIGTIRQDINISIEGHNRVEIKGFQDADMMEKTVELEAKRQEGEIKKKKITGEVRKANVDGTTDYLRPLPGSARMYPETDLPLLRISRDVLDNAKKSLPKLRSEISKELKKKGLDEGQIKILLKERMLEEFGSLLKILNEPKFVYKILIEIPKDLASRFKDAERLSVDVVEEVLSNIVSGQIGREDAGHVLEEITKGQSVEEALKIEKADLSEIEGEIAKLVKEKPGLSIGGYMGLIMSKFKGKVSGKEVNEILGKLVK